jgi:hypothetical protein
MIKDPDALEETQQAWKTVRVAQAMVKTNLNAGMFGLVPQTHGFRNLSHGLVLLFAYAVLEDTLSQLAGEGVFMSKGWQLKSLMKESKKAIAWIDFDLVDQGRDCRNDLAHRQKIPERADSWRYVDAVEAELIGWEVLPGPVKAEFTIDVTPQD